MAKPIVAVVGRPNVGKSTLVNRIIQRRDAIVHESRGVTRDRSYHEADWNGRDFVLIDTGGIESLSSNDPFAGSIRAQAAAACAEADAIVFVVDGTTGTVDEDEVVARVLRKTSKPVLLVANKLDDPSREQELWELYSLGIGEPHPISASHGIGVGDLLDEIVSVLPEEREGVDYPSDALNVAVIGRPNAGKSSLVNRIAGVERSIVSDVAGTTRDAVDVVVEHDGRPIRLVDTAGMRKRSQVHEDVEYYSIVRGYQALDAADIALLVVDSSVGVTEQDQKVAVEAIERGCGLVILLNKWDLVRDERARQVIAESLSARMTLATWAPVLRISALSGRSVDKIWDMVESAAEARSSRASTPELNRMLERIRESGFTRTQGNKRLKVTYVTQTGSEPPVFTFFCNHPELADANYRRFMENRLRETFDLVGTPIRLKFRGKEA